MMSTSNGSAFVAVNQTVTKVVGPPYRRRAKNAVLNNPSLLRVMGTMEKALDVSGSISGKVVELSTKFIKFEEFPVDIPRNLDDEDRTRWVRIREGRQSSRTLGHTSTPFPYFSITSSVYLPFF